MLRKPSAEARSLRALSLFYFCFKVFVLVCWLANTTTRFKHNPNAYFLPSDLRHSHRNFEREFARRFVKDELRADLVERADGVRREAFFLTRGHCLNALNVDVR